MREQRSERLPSRRLFFAIWPSEAQQHMIERDMRSFVEASRGRPIPARNLHATLAFLGGIPESRIEVVKACAAQVGSNAGFDLRFDRVETWGRARVLCLTASSMPAALSELVERLRFNLLSMQFEIRQEEFRVHVTLARDAQSRIHESLRSPIEWRVEEFVLVQSTPGSSGSEYRVLERWRLSSAE